MHLSIIVFEQVPHGSLINDLDLLHMTSKRGRSIIDANYIEHTSRYVIYRMEAKAE